MPRDDHINETPAESPAESMQDQLWNMIETCKQNDHAYRNGHARSSANGCAGGDDKVLVNALSAILREDHNSAAPDGLAARARLVAEITRGVPAAPQASARRFWVVPNKRQFLLVAALIIITVAALGYLFMASQPNLCPPGKPKPPVLKVPPKPPMPVPNARNAEPSVRIDRLLASSDASIVAPAAHWCL